MLVLNGIFRDNLFIPDYEVPMPDGTRVVISVEESTLRMDQKKTQQKEAWHSFFEEIRALRSLNDELPHEFDEIIEKGMVFNHVDLS